MLEIIKKVENNFAKFNKAQIIEIKSLKQSGSYRKYFRVFFEKNNSILGVYNPDKTENEAFIYFSEHFKSKLLNVPEIYKYFPEDKIYFIEDLGDLTLFDFLMQNPSEQQIDNAYKNILKHLLNFQTQAIKDLDLSKCYPRKEFDKQSILWDLNYFKYFVLKQAKVNFNEQRLEDDFNKLADFLTNTNTDFFLFRDFQSKNIMIKNNDFYFIDYQGGRKGAIYYDLASLLFDSKANLSKTQIENLLEYYYSLISDFQNISSQEFYSFFYHYVLIRILQAFGAYGFRGLVEKKSHFIASIPKAIENIKNLLKNKYLNLDLPELKNSLVELTNNSYFTEMFKTFKNVKIRINSFSFHKDGYPVDKKNNGGGFVFDCRFLPNPGREEKYKNLSGLDKKVIDFLEALPEVEEFIVKTVDIIRNAAQAFEKNSYTDLQINFGCTGGRHRSVYCAEKTAEILKNWYNADVKIKHLQQKNW